MTTPFKMALNACGLTQDDAVEYFGWSRPSVTKKSAGLRRMTQEDAARLRTLYAAIVEGRTDNLPEGAELMSYTLRILRGEVEIKPVAMGRPRLDAED